MPHRNDATDAYVGYLHQGRYALVALIESRDANAVSVETDDDVVLEGRETTLSQLKHSLGVPPNLTLSNVGLWKTLKIWSEREFDAAASGLPNTTRYCFVTVADLAQGHVLEGAATDALRSAATNQAIAEALATEAQRVADERAAHHSTPSAAPHSERAGGCASFLRLTPERRLDLVRRMTVLPRSFRIVDIEARIAASFEGLARASVRPRLAERLVEWWDGQVARALTAQRDRRITKEEVAAKANDLLVEYRDESLPDHYSALSPTPEEVAAGRATNIARQIELVRGGGSRIDRAVLARWRARGQRERWLSEDVSLADILEQFDDRLKEAWAERHGPMCDDSADLPESDRCAHGLRLLDWAYSRAPSEVPPPRREWQSGYYTHGMLQQFADDLHVGWHPDFRARLGPPAIGAPVPGAIDDSANEDSRDEALPPVEAASAANTRRRGQRSREVQGAAPDDVPVRNGPANSADEQQVARQRAPTRRRSSRDTP